MLQMNRVSPSKPVAPFLTANICALHRNASARVRFGRARSLRVLRHEISPRSVDPTRPWVRASLAMKRCHFFAL
jgi:hypothetical protein